VTVALTWNGPAITAAVEAAATAGLLLAAEFVLQSTNLVVPLDEGPLMNSGAVGVDGLTASISYNTPYAVRQHEDLTYRHANGRTAKYLENTLNAQQQAAMDIVAQRIRQGIGT